jgi:hypothetical protein
MGDTKADAGVLEEAMRMYREAIAIEGCKDKARAYYGLGLLYMLRQEASRAGDEFRAALKVHHSATPGSIRVCVL